MKEEKKELRPSMLVRLVWALCATNDTPSPLLVPMLEQMCTKWRELPITPTEMLDIHQIVGYIDLMVEKKALPEEIKSWISQDLREQAEEYYKSVDKRPYPEIREEIAKELTEREIAVECDTYIRKMLKLDIIIKGKKAGILIHGKEIFNEDKKLRGAEYIKFLEAKDFTLFPINVEEWNSWEDDKKQEKLKEIVKLVKKL